MKKQHLALIAALLMATATQLIAQKKHEENFRKTVSVGEETLLVVGNIFGDVTVQGYEGNEIVVEAKKRIWAESSSELEKGKQEVKLAVEKVGSFVDVFIDSPASQGRREERTKEGYGYRNYRWSKYEMDYEFRFDLVIKVPNHLSLDVGTINEGKLTISDMRSPSVRGHNVNGGVTLENISAEEVVAMTVNGNVRVSYATNPTEEAEYRTINGEIEVALQSDLSAQLFFKSMHGEFFSEFEVQPIQDTEQLMTRVGKGKSKLKLSVASAVQVGSGAVKHRFNTLNGDVYLKKG